MIYPGIWSLLEKMKGDYPGYLEIIDKENPQLDLVLCENKDKLDNREKLTWLHFAVKNKA